ncbi:hypothetical protein N1E17_01720 [Lacticaseibacillus paracasei]|jgi:hypothetical protein|uniref:Uncharacterized protein n=1 Tax=Lacticaseibacillus paracasei subsp. paracasei Lpp71 TaxID=1256207 RepID=A0A8E0ITW9_LACPA|nr:MULTISPECIES: hypothetical protein [Lacticaseibacillus]EPC29895.1 hypothetical protein Lpp120_2471 [Lacticaseibacillus paracasei subsp. paracasei Lpp120]EPC77242.1 hypothetical protein Lpp71_02114 [Lacticaseibacillus paracasei subsp. paracasei Lpp71]WFB41608.1 hypothetical protein LHUE2_002457 [Lacticaseibacillus huelsenbergensis]MDB7668467.1 hypothetical protein [Lacticaseibacillus rhamnosus]MDE3300106.1 hypothetical protein [Lacticaseibacillus rhamnosus]
MDGNARPRVPRLTNLDGAPGGLTADRFPKRFWFNVTTGDDGGLTMTYTNVADEGDEE